MSPPKQSPQKRSHTNFLSLPRELHHQVLNYTFEEFKRMYLDSKCAKARSQTLIEADDNLYEDVKFLGYKRILQILDNHDEKSKKRKDYL